MSLSKDEKNLEVVLDALKSKVQLERARAINRLNHLNLWTGANDIETITNALSVAHDKETIKAGKKKIKKILDKYTIHLNRTEEERAEVIRKIKEENDIKIKKEKERIEAQKRKKELEEKARIESIKLRKEQRIKAQEKLILENNKIIEEENEIESFTYLSRESSRRFPFHRLYISIIRIVAGTILVLGVLGFLFFLVVGGIEFVVGGLFVLLWSAIVAFFTILGSEIIRLLLDFHDNNHVNTKIRIETLNALKEINKNLEKKK